MTGSGPFLVRHHCSRLLSTLTPPPGPSPSTPTPILPLRYCSIVGHGLQLLPNPSSGLGNSSGTRFFVLSFIHTHSYTAFSSSSVHHQYPLSSPSLLVRLCLLSMLRIIFSDLEEDTGRGYDFYNAHAASPDP